MRFTLYLLYGVLFLKRSDSELFLHLRDFRKSRFDGANRIQRRLRTLMATVNDQDTRELLEDTIALIEMNRYDREMSRKYVYPPRASVANTSCNWIHKYL